MHIQRDNLENIYKKKRPRNHHPFHPTAFTRQSTMKNRQPTGVSCPSSPSTQRRHNHVGGGLTTQRNGQNHLPVGGNHQTITWNLFLYSISFFSLSLFSNYILDGFNGKKCISFVVVRFFSIIYSWKLKKFMYISYYYYQYKKK